MRLLALLSLCACAPKDDTGLGDTRGETDQTGDTQVVRDCAPADVDPEPTWEGHLSDGWRWAKQGALFEDSEALAYGEGELAPSLVDVGGTLHLIFTRQRGLDQDLWVSTNADGEGWSEPVAATGLEPGSAGYAGLLYDQGLFQLWYGSGNIGHRSE